MAHAPTPALTHAAPADQADARSRWQAHLDAGRIGHRLPVDPATTAIRATNKAVLRGRSIGR